MKRGCHCATSRDARAQAARQMWTLCDMRPRLRPRGAGRQQRTAAPGTLPVSVQRPPTGSQAGTRPPWQKRAAGRRGPLATCAPGAGQLAPLRLASGPAPREGPPGRPRQRPLRGDTRLPTAGSRPPKGCWPATPTATPTAPPTRAGDGRARGAGGGGGAPTPSMSEGWSRPPRSRRTPSCHGCQHRQCLTSDFTRGSVKPRTPKRTPRPRAQAGALPPLRP